MACSPPGKWRNYLIGKVFFGGDNSVCPGVFFVGIARSVYRKILVTLCHTTPMPPIRICPMCESPDRADFDRRLKSGELTPVELAKTFRVPYLKAYNHYRRHVLGATTLREKGVQARKVLAYADDLIGASREVREKLAELEGLARDGGELSEILSVIDRQIKAIETQAKIAGKIQDSTVNVLVQNPTFINLQAVILQALEPFPEAREAVIAALEAEMKGMQAVSQFADACAVNAQKQALEPGFSLVQGAESTQVIDI